MCAHFYLQEYRYYTQPQYYIVTGIDVGESETLRLPSTHKGLPVTICDFLYIHAPERVRHLIIPSSYTDLRLRNSTFPNLETLEILPGNKQYKSVDNMLFSADMHTLYLVLTHARDPALTVPQSVQKLGPHAFEDSCCTKIEFLNPDVVCQRGSFAGSQYLAQQGAVAMVGNCFYLLQQRVRVLELPQSARCAADDCFSHYTPEEIIAPFYLHTYGVRSYTLTDPHADIPLSKLNELTYLANIHVPEDHDTYRSLGGVLFSKPDRLVFYPPGRAQRHYTIPDGTTDIAFEAFAKHRFLISVTFPTSLRRIEISAFAQCSALSNIQLPEGLTHIETAAFRDSAIESLTLPSTLQCIDNAAFAECSQLHTVTWATSKKPLKLGAKAFSQCSALSDIQLPEGLTHIGEDCFAGASIKSLTLPSTLQTLDAQTLSEIESITVWEGSAKGLMQALAIKNRWGPDKWKTHYLTVRSTHFGKPGPVSSDPDTPAYRLLLPEELTEDGEKLLPSLWDGQYFHWDTYLALFEQHTESVDVRQEMAIVCSLYGPPEQSEPFRTYLRRCGWHVCKRLVSEKRIDLLCELLRGDLVTPNTMHKLLAQVRDMPDIDPALPAYLLELLSRKKTKRAALPL